MIIDANNQVVGRMATYVAKAALKGEKIEIVNCEKAVVSGNKVNVINRFKAKVSRGEPFHGPFYPKTEDQIVRRIVRGMLPWKIARGREAYKRVKCYIGVPANLKDKKYDKFKDTDVSRLDKARYTRLEEVSKSIGKKNVRRNKIGQ